MFGYGDNTWETVTTKLDELEAQLLKELRSEADHSTVRYIQGQLKAVSTVRQLPTIIAKVK